MKTTADIMSLANDYANADNVIDSAQKQQALRLAVDAALSAPAGWIPVSKGLPGVDQARCFVIAPKASQGDLWPTKWCLDGQVFEAAFGGFFEPSEVTYWMYAADLPAAPSPQEPTDV